MKKKTSFKHLLMRISCITSFIIFVFLILSSLQHVAYNTHLALSNFSSVTSCAVDRGFEQRSDRTNDYEISVCYFSANHVTLKRKSKTFSVRNQNGETCLPMNCCCSVLAL